MKVQITRIDKTLPLPIRETEGSIGFDLIAREDVIVGPLKPVLIPSNIIIKVPRGYMFQISLRSSAPRKYRIMMPHGVGIIDNDYCGPEDEIMIQVQRTVPNLLKIKRGTKIAQGIFVKVEADVFWEEKETIDRESRGGFGSTDA